MQCIELGKLASPIFEFGLQGSCISTEMVEFILQTVQFLGILSFGPAQLRFGISAALLPVPLLLLLRENQCWNLAPTEIHGVKQWLQQ